MSTPENRTEVIERYLLQQLDEPDRLAFEKQLEEDATLRQEVDLQRRLVQQIRVAGRENLRSELKQFHRRIDVQPVERPLFRSYWIAASVALVLLVGGILLLRNQSTTTGDTSQLATIKFLSSGTNGLGMAGHNADSTMVIRMYTAVAGAVLQYRFDDTLRLYGDFEPARLTLTYQPATETYLLKVDSVSYSLERFAPVQPLKPVRKEP